MGVGVDHTMGRICVRCVVDWAGVDHTVGHMSAGCVVEGFRGNQTPWGIGALGALSGGLGVDCL